MAKTTTAKKTAKKTSGKPAEEQTPARGGDPKYAQYCCVLLLAGVMVLLWLSLLTFSPFDPPATEVHPPQPAQNAIGRVGAEVAYQLRYWLGKGAYVGMLFGTFAVGVMLVRKRLHELPWRVCGVVVLTAATSAAVYLSDPAMGELSRYSGGILGQFLGKRLLVSFAPTGSWTIVTVMFGVGVALTADHLLRHAFYGALWMWRKRGHARTVLQLALPNAATQSLAEPETRTRNPAKVVAPKAVPAPAKMEPDDVSETPDPPAAPPRVSIPPVKLTPRPVPKSAPTPDQAQQPASRDYDLPSAALLAEPRTGYVESQEVQVLLKRAVLQQTLNDFNVAAEVVGHMTGPVITMFELSLAPGVKVASVARLSNDISRALAVPGVRVVSPLPGRDTIGIEVPNMEKEIVRIKELMDMDPEAEEKMILPLYLGKDAEGQAIIYDLASMPHMLIAGTTGSGKSVCINAIIMALLMKRRPEDVRFILIDPKMVEMAAFEGLPHLLCPIVNDMRRAEDILEWAATKMDERYEILKEAGVKNIASFNELSDEVIYERFGAETEEDQLRVPTSMPYYVIIVDELADLIMTSSKDVENHIIRIAQKARAVGIHLILATQRPSVNVVTGLVKSNMPCRISFRVASRQESRIVLDQNGAEVLLGQGDMLVLKPGTSNLSRAQGTYVDDSEIRSITKQLRRTGDPVYNVELMRLNSYGGIDGGGEKDELFTKAVAIILASGRGSVSLLQRRLSIGYSRASRIVDQMADAGLLGDHKGSQARECMITLEEWESLQAGIEADLSGESAFDGTPTSS